ncbi:SAM-dependent methyltransferase [Plantactinospora soyae]|uniref:27-O-demethylrifamycin SV methyltransferase n=1 Tax=Plantactinospora soyae TaxID=1544732 RepID=A0A927QYY2_9ACTN|nr:class I SAM-dependent methyltransferase [Plantactinospora soyae]MBE1489750.1 27-O-demethylrifamycin SV methyltransferase [Plantactinospora soyae]
MSELNANPADIAKFYDGASALADKYFGGYQRQGYWYDDSDDATLEEGAGRLTRKVVDTLGLHRGERLLEAGCGTGTASIDIAGAYGVRVTGITISPVEAARSRARAQQSGAAEQTQFEVADYHSLPFADAEFDAVVAFESLFNAYDLEHALREFHRVLRPGGRVAMSEISKTTDASPLKRPFPLAREPMTAESWTKAFESVGFVVEERIQSRRVYVNTGKRHLMHFESVRDQITEEFGAEMTEGIRHGMREAFHLGPEDVTYLILCARKQ